MKSRKGRKTRSRFRAVLAGNRNKIQDIIDYENDGPIGTLLDFMPDNYLVCMGSIGLEPMKRSKVSNNLVSDLKNFF